MVSRQLWKQFFFTIKFKKVSTSYNAEDVLQLLEEDDSEFPDSVSSGKEGNGVYSYSGPSFRANQSEYSSSDSDVRWKHISDSCKLIL